MYYALHTLMICALCGGMDPALGRMAIGLSPVYLMLNSPTLEPEFTNEISLEMTLLLASTLPKSTLEGNSREGRVGYLEIQP